VEKKRVLVTGGMGFVGANIAYKFMEEGYETILYDITQREVDFLEEKKEQWRFVEGDVTDLDKVLETAREYNIEGIIHCAYITNPGTEGLAKVNFDACHILLEVCKQTQSKFVFISSNAAYGYRPDSNPLVETDFVPVLTGTLIDEYSAIKVICETLTTMYHAVYGVDSVSCRISWVYGPGVFRGRYPQWFLAHAMAGIPVKLDKGREHEADYTYVKDAARGVYLAYTIRPIKHRLYNITSGRKISAGEVAETIKEIIPGAVIEIGPGQMEKGLGNPTKHPPQVGTMLTARAEKDLGYTMTSLEQGLKETAEWYRRQPKIIVTSAYI